MSLVVVFDASYIFYKTLFTLSSAYTDNAPFLENEIDQQQFIRKVITDFAFTVNTIEANALVCVCFDSTSWRKKIEIEGTQGYKNNRGKDHTKVSWENFYKLLQEFKDILEVKGIQTFKIDGAEADDILALLSLYYFENGSNVILITSDRDLYQCVKLSPEKNNFVAIYAASSKKIQIIGAVGFGSALESSKNIKADIFDLAPVNSFSVIEKLLRQDGSILQEVDVDEFQFKKILTGDGGDTVPSVYRWKKNDKTYSITDLMSTRILEELRETQPDLDIKKILQEDMQPLLQEINKKCAVKAKQEPLSDFEFFKAWNRNRILMILDRNIIPENIQKIVDLRIQYYKENPQEKISYFNAKTLLASTKYENAEQKVNFMPSSQDIFSLFN